MDYWALKIDNFKKCHCLIQHYMEPTTHLTIISTPWTTGTMLDFLGSNFYFEMPFFSFHNPKISERDTQAFLENGSVEENILPRSYITIWYSPYMPWMRNLSLCHSLHPWIYSHTEYMGSFTHFHCWSM